jgi:Kef-type K+ transport system membrane component KefB
MEGFRCWTRVSIFFYLSAASLNLKFLSFQFFWPRLQIQLVLISLRMLTWYVIFLMFLIFQTQPSKRGAFQTGLGAAFRRPDLILQGDHALSGETSSNSPSNEDLSVHL